MAWNVILLEEVEAWFLALVEQQDDGVESVMAAIEQLVAQGPTLGRPLADRLHGSRLHSLKELRPVGTSIRILFVFDPDRSAVLLVAGDKRGVWDRWYDENIPLAESRYVRWLAQK